MMPDEKQMNDIKKSDDKNKCILRNHFCTEWSSATNPFSKECNGNDIETLDMHRALNPT